LTKRMSTTRKRLLVRVIKNQLQKWHYEKSITKMVLSKNNYKKKLSKVVTKEPLFKNFVTTKMGEMLTNGFNGY
jgi:hypothetical protein